MIRADTYTHRMVNSNNEIKPTRYLRVGADKGIFRRISGFNIQKPDLPIGNRELKNIDSMGKLIVIGRYGKIFNLVKKNEINELVDFEILHEHFMQVFKDTEDSLSERKCFLSEER